MFFFEFVVITHCLIFRVQDLSQLPLAILNNLAVGVNGDFSSVGMDWSIRLVEVLHDESEDRDLLVLSNAMRASDSLSFHGRIPVRASEIYLLEVLKIEPFASRLNLHN